MARRAALWVLVPVRGIARGKSRLAGTLDPVERCRLNRHLLAHTVNVVRRWLGDAGTCVVVSPCARALGLARRAGATAWREPSGAADLNAALAWALGRIARCGGGRVMVLASDLPGLEPAALDALLASAGRVPGMRMALAPDLGGSGTNALCLRAPLGMRPCYGDGSAEAHLAAARSRGWSAGVVVHPALALDLDTPADRARLCTHGLPCPARGAILAPSRPRSRETNRRSRAPGSVRMPSGWPSPGGPDAPMTVLEEDA